MVSNLLMGIASMYWGIQNTGEPQRINIGHFTSGYVKGLPGEDIHLPPAKIGSSTVIVAVLDTGIDSTHPDLKDLIAPGGKNFAGDGKGENDTTDVHGHGTHLSGIIATQVSKNVRILPVKVVQTGPNAPIRPQGIEPGEGTALTEQVAAGVEYAVQKGARVINLSLAWPNSIRSKKMDAAMAFAEQKDVVVVASAANDSTSTNLYPCIYRNVICVGAHGPDGSFSYFSNYGAMVDLLAPGIAILSTWPMNKAPVTFAGQIGYEFRNGTSMAAPFVAGAAAELIARGYSAQETKNRLLLGTRATRTESLYSTVMVGQYSTDHKKEGKFSRFGNMDVSRALEVSPQSLVLPLEKSRHEISWNGTDSKATSNVAWKNNWKDAKNVHITVANQSFDFASIKEGEVVSTPIRIDLNETTESVFDLFATIETLETDGSRITRKIPLSFSVNRLISLNTIPSNAIRLSFDTLQPNQYPFLKNAINVDRSKNSEIFFVRGSEVILTRDGKELGRAKISDLILNNALNLYRFDDFHYALITEKKEQGQSRPSIVVRFLNEKLVIQKELKIGTETTIVPEGFAWKKATDGNALMWLSIGYTPPLEKPKYDPWDPDYKDIKTQRVYYNEGNDLRTIPLADDEIPVQILPDKNLLIAKGNSYNATYFILTIDLATKEKITHRQEVSLLAYRMLLGLDTRNEVLSLKGSLSTSIAMIGASTPGNLRSTLLSSSKTATIADDLLIRESTLDSLVEVAGVFSGPEYRYYFVQTNYDLKFFRSGSLETHSQSLNRYSYIPVMASQVRFFPVLLKDSQGRGFPTVYRPQSLSNAFVSEFIFGDPDTGTMKRPALFHMETSSDCLAMANVISATESAPAYQPFICGKEIILLPLEIRQ